MAEEFGLSEGHPKPSGKPTDAASLLPMIRNRHGRSIRRVSLSPLFAQSSSRVGSFEDIVKNTVEFIKANFTDDLGEMKYEIYDSPTFRPDTKRVRRWAVKTDQMTIVIYRLPIERFGQHRRKSPFEIRMSIEFQVFSAAAELIGREPDFFLDNH
ncbi:MAG: hypothetical protein RL196_360 [Actinomycetota bacterium]|jgi:hypothetical protein